MSIGGIRIQRSDLPRERTPCPLPRPCVYRKDGDCGDASTNKGNSDAACHAMANRVVLRMLETGEAPK